MLLQDPAAAAHLVFWVTLNKIPRKCPIEAAKVRVEQTKPRRMACCVGRQSVTPDRRERGPEWT